MPTQQGTYNVGDLARLWGEFRDDDDDPQDPTTVNLSIREPGGRIRKYTYGTHAALIKDSVGNYYLDYSVPAGWTFFRWHSEGTGQAAVEEAIYGRPARAMT